MRNRDISEPDRQWQATPPKILCKTPIGNLVSSEVRSVRTGKQKTFFRFTYPDWVNVVAITGANELVLIKQYRFGSGRIETEIPGGMVEPGESPIDAGLRELLEETGYGGGIPRLIGSVCPNPALQHNTCSTILVEGVSRKGDPRQDEMEDIELLLVPVQEIPAMIHSGELSHGLVLNGLFFAQLAGAVSLLEKNHKSG